MIKDDCGGVWLDWPHVITLFDDDGNERDYTPERTTTMITDEGSQHWYSCDTCECDGYAAKLPNYCPNCGAKVVRDEERG